MKTIAEVRKALADFSGEELAELERSVREARQEKERGGKPSLREIAPVSVGRILQPLGSREEWYDEMREERR
jgi:hypothetical protein